MENNAQKGFQEKRAKTKNDTGEGGNNMAGPPDQARSGSATVAQGTDLVAETNAKNLKLSPQAVRTMHVEEPSSPQSPRIEAWVKAALVLVLPGLVAPSLSVILLRANWTLLLLVFSGYCLLTRSWAYARQESLSAEAFTNPSSGRVRGGRIASFILILLTLTTNLLILIGGGRLFHPMSLMVFLLFAMGCSLYVRTKGYSTAWAILAITPAIFAIGLNYEEHQFGPGSLMYKMWLDALRDPVKRQLVQGSATWFMVFPYHTYIALSVVWSWLSVVILFLFPDRSACKATSEEQVK